MRLGAKILKNVASVNHYEYAEYTHIQEGQVNEFYIQIFDLDKLPTGNSALPLRYMPKDDSSLDVVFPALNSDNEVKIIATQPFTEDKSIWKVALTSEQIVNSGALKIKLTEGSIERFYIISSGIYVDTYEVGGC